jgi:hypothetical protein
LNKLGETLLKLHESYPDPKAKELILGLDVRWNELKTNSDDMVKLVEDTGKESREYDEKLQGLVSWAQEVQEVLDGLEKVDDYGEFQTLVHKFQVRNVLFIA